jgi:RND family efflux transporter MFP subunit
VTSRNTLLLGSLTLACCLFTAAGCSRKEAKMGDDKPVAVVVTPAVTREVIDHEDFTGRIEAIDRIDLRARVTGYLQKVDFKEGATVKKGDLLFQIDPRGYKAEFDLTEAKVGEANVRVKRLKADFDRAKVLRANNSISREEFDKIAGDYNEAVAAVDSAIATRQVAKTNLEWTQVVSPVTGVTSRAMIDPGNLVKADETILTTIVSLDPIYAYFDVDERTDLKLERLVREGKIKSSKDSDVTVLLALADEEDFKDHVGTINFVDNHLEPTTGTKRIRGIFPNPQRLLAPGQFVRIRLPIGTPHRAVIVPEIAVGSDQGQKYVYVVDKDNEVSYRKIKVGQQMKTYRVVEPPVYKLKKDGTPDLDAQGRKVLIEGLEEGEKVVVNGLQRVRPRIKVDAKVEEIPATAGLSQTPSLMRPNLANLPAAPPSKGAASTP